METIGSREKGLGHRCALETGNASQGRHWQSDR